MNCEDIKFLKKVGDILIEKLDIGSELTPVFSNESCAALGFKSNGVGYYVTYKYSPCWRIGGYTDGPCVGLSITLAKRNKLYFKLLDVISEEDVADWVMNIVSRGNPNKIQVQDQEVEDSAESLFNSIVNIEQEDKYRKFKVTGKRIPNEYYYDGNIAKTIDWTYLTVEADSGSLTLVNIITFQVNKEISTGRIWYSYLLRRESIRDGLIKDVSGNYLVKLDNNKDEENIIPNLSSQHVITDITEAGLKKLIDNCLTNTLMELPEIYEGDTHLENDISKYIDLAMKTMV